MSTHFSNSKSGAISDTNLSAVTTATDGAAVEMRDFHDKTVFVEIPVNTGAVTVVIEASYDGTTWFELDSTVYTTTTGLFMYSTTVHTPFMRATTITQTTSTVTATITGGN